MPYWQLFYHLVWATKNRETRITAEVEPIIYDLLQTKALELEAVVFAINGIEDHVHMVAAIPPKIAVAKFVGQVKGFASTLFNRRTDAETPFFWQAEYAAFSFDRKRLPNFVAYVENQKIHHAERTTIPVLERIEGEGVQLIRESSALYELDEAGWRRDLEE